MLEIAGGILLALAILFIGLPVAFFLMRTLWPLWVSIGLGFIIALIAAVIAHGSDGYDADSVFLLGWPLATILIGGFWAYVHDEMEKHKSSLSNEVELDGS